VSEKLLTFEHIEIPDSIKELESVTQADGIRFYSTPSGKSYPSVTTVTGWEKKAFFAEWRKNNPEESRRVLSNGTNFHKLIEGYLGNAEHLIGTPAAPRLLFQNIKPLLHNIDKIRAQEVPLWSDTLHLAGRVDCIAEYKGKLSVIDFKSSKREKRKADIDNYFAQATAYAIMWQEITGEPINQIAILISCEGGVIQEFVDKPTNHVKRLKEMIDFYWYDNSPFKSY